MITLLRTCIAAACLLTLNAPAAFAQVDAGVSITGIISVQPVNDAYIGSPYLDEGIGGVRPGLAIGVDVVTPGGLAVIGELSTTQSFEQLQTGRLVWANRSNFSHEGSATARLRDTLISALAGYVRSTPARRVVFAGGISYVHTTLRQDDLNVEEQVGDFGLEGRRRYALTGGVDVAQRLSLRAALVIGARYSWLGRSEVADQTGAGEHLLRLGGGIRIGFGH